MDETAAEKKALSKKRWVFNTALLGLLVISFTISRYSVEIMSLLSGLPPEQIADRGIEPLQSVMIALYKLPIGIVYSALLATFTEKQLRPDAFGSYSRWGIIFSLCLLCFCLLVGK